LEPAGAAEHPPARPGIPAGPAGHDLRARRCPGVASYGRDGAAAGALAVAGPVLAACGTTSTGSSPSSGSSGKPSGNRKKIGFSQPDTSASIWAPLMAGAQQECKARGYELLESHANSQLNGQLSEIETWIGENVGAIVALPLDNNAIVPLIHKAHAAGTKFLDYSDNALPGVDGWVIFDNLQGAKLVGTYAGQWVKQNLGGRAQVALLTHQIQLTGRQRVEGCVKALQAVAPGAKVVAQHEGVLSRRTRSRRSRPCSRLIPGSTSRSASRTRAATACCAPSRARTRPPSGPRTCSSAASTARGR